MCSLLCVSFSLVIHYNFSIALSAFILIWTPKLWKHAQLLATKTNYFRQLPHFFLSLNTPPATFIFSSVHYFLINTWSSKLIWPISISLCVPCTTTWKHLVSSLWMNVADLMFQLLHIHNLLTLFVLTPLHSPYTPFIDYAHLSTNYENTFGDCTYFSINCAHNFDDYANTPNDRMNITVNSTDMPNISSLDLCIPNPTLLQLLFIYILKIKVVFTIGSMIYYLSSAFFIYGFYISHPSSSSSMSEFVS